MWCWVFVWASSCAGRQEQILRPYTATRYDSTQNFPQICTSESCNNTEVPASHLKQIPATAWISHMYNKRAAIWEILSRLGANQEPLVWPRKPVGVAMWFCTWRNGSAQQAWRRSSTTPSPTLLGTKPAHPTVPHSSQTCFWSLTKKRKAGHCPLPSSSSLHCQVSYSFITPYST